MGYPNELSMCHKVLLPEPLVNWAAVDIGVSMSVSKWELQLGFGFISACPFLTHSNECKWLRSHLQWVVVVRSAPKQMWFG